jgi:hypothetical protein
MSEEKKPVSRRSFLKGAAVAGVAAAAAGSGLFVQKLSAQGGYTLARSDVREEPGVQDDKDLVPMAENLFKTSVEGGYDAFNAAFESFVKGNNKTADVKSLLAEQGLKLRSREASGAARSFEAPPSLLKLRMLQLKQKGWHAHCVFSAWGLRLHGHVSW